MWMIYDPNSIDVIQAILGDRGKAKRTHADDPDSG